MDSGKTDIAIDLFAMGSFKSTYEATVSSSYIIFQSFENVALDCLFRDTCGKLFNYYGLSAKFGRVQECV